MTSPAALFAAARARRPLLDHVVRALGRYQADAGDRLASSVTFYWFLSLFPILLIAVFVVSRALGDDAGTQVTSGLRPYLGVDTAKAVGDVVQSNAGKAGLVGLAGTLLSGLGWINALRTAIRTIWHQNVNVGNIVVTKVRDIVALVGLFAVVAASVVVSGAATATTASVLSLLGLSETTGAKALTIGLSYVLGFLVDMGIFLYLFLRFSKARSPLRQVVRGAVFGAVGFELLKLGGAFYIGRTTTKGEATYGTFAVVVGLLLFLNLVSRLILVTAAFVVTAPYDSDVAPSGTADPESARKAGIPQEYVGTDLTMQQGGAPTPLREALQRSEGGPDRSWSRREPPPPPDPAAAPDLPAHDTPLKGARQVVLAARVLRGFGGVALLAALARAVRSVTRRSR